MTRIVLDALSKSFGENTAVDWVNIVIETGSITALLGPSGCGKTTLLRLIAGFEEPSAGRILFGERLVASAEASVPPERRGIGIVFQSYALWPHMDVAANVAYPLEGRGLKRATISTRVAEALALVSLTGLEHRSVDALSGGQRQRVALARCLVSGTDIILLDEPLSNLDVHLRAEMLEVFAELHRKTGATIVFVTHDQSEALALADRIVVLDRGKVQQAATPKQLYREPANVMVAGFVGQGSLVAGRTRGDDIVIDNHALRARGTARGDAVTLLLRPENLALASAGLQAIVQATRYIGSGYETKLVLRSGESVMLVSKERLEPGQAVHIEINDVWIIPD